MKNPTIGQLNKRITIERIKHVPVGDLDTREEVEMSLTVWAYQQVLGASMYYGEVSTNESISHRFTIRTVKGKTEPKDLSNITRITCEGIQYELKRASILECRGRFTVLDVTELGVNRA